MYNTDSSPEVRNCAFIANSDSGMVNSYGEPLLINCTFMENATDDTGAGMYNSAASPTIINSVFFRNVCQQGGGGMYNYFSDPVLINCTFSENETNNPEDYEMCSGGAICNMGSNPILNNCIVWNNPSCYNGTEIFNVDDTDCPSIPIISYSCIAGGYEGIGNIDVDPLLIPTMGSRGAIQPNSPCINAGTADGAPDDDLRGVSRPQDGAVDMGAYELDDSDGDGISDAWEQRSFGNLTQATEISDADNDGLSDLNESLFGANPANSDSDGDGMADGEEVAQGYDPVIPMRVYRVNLNNTSGVEDGLSWGTAFSSIQPAMDEAQRRGEGQVWVATGVYTATTDFVVVLKRHVALLGGFNGAEINPEARDWTAYPTIIDGQSARPCIQGANGAVLDGFTVQNGLAQYYGGGMLNEGTAPRIIHCIFKQNSASYGGAIYNLKASPSIMECTFLANTASDGAGIYDYASTPVISNCVFDQNTARYSGGGICDYNNSAPIIQACTFIANTASSRYKGGGAMYVVSSSPVLTNCLFARNSALKGAALYLYSQPDYYYDYFKGDPAAPCVMNCVFANNLAETLGGALYNSSDTAPVITNSIFWNNLAGDVIDEIQTSDFGVAPLITYSCIDTAYEGLGNLIADPLFLDPANDGYRLQLGSPCIDTGAASGAPKTDILGAARPQGGGFDMGAYEYVP